MLFIPSVLPALGATLADKIIRNHVVLRDSREGKAWRDLLGHELYSRLFESFAAKSSSASPIFRNKPLLEEFSAILKAEWKKTFQDLLQVHYIRHAVHDRDLSTYLIVVGRSGLKFVLGRQRKEPLALKTAFFPSECVHVASDQRWNATAEQQVMSFAYLEKQPGKDLFFHPLRSDIKEYEDSKYRKRFVCANIEFESKTDWGFVHSEESERMPYTGLPHPSWQPLLLFGKYPVKLAQPKAQS